MLADIPPPPELLELFKTPAMVEVLPPLFDRPGRTSGQTSPARPAIRLQGPVGLQRHIGQDGHQTDSGPEIGMDKKVVSSDVAQPGPNRDFFMGDMGRLFLHVQDLGGGNRKSPETGGLDIRGQVESRPVQEKIELPVMMKIKRRGMVFDIFKDRIQNPPRERNGPVEPASHALGKAEFRPKVGNVGDPDGGEAQVESFCFQSFGVFPERRRGVHGRYSRCEGRECQFGGNRIVSPGSP